MPWCGMPTWGRVRSTRAREGKIDNSGMLRGEQQNGAEKELKSEASLSNGLSFGALFFWCSGEQPKSLGS